ncbi:MAG: ATP-binding cassette domain-containing protein [Clostridia bacterium]|nr:ATP-binding cassette domain-containing protein [Clostridia bacterium]
MGWFDEQIEYRKKHERELLSDSFENLARSVTGRRTFSALDADADVSDALHELLRHLGIKEKDVPEKIRALRDRLDFLLSSTGVLYREINLTPGWHADAIGPMIASLKDSGAVIAVLPSAMGGYEYTDPHSGVKKRVTSGSEKLINSEALCFYRPLPMQELGIRDLFKYMLECLTPRDAAGFLCAALAVTLVGLLVPKLNQILMGTVVELGSYRLLYATVGFMCFTLIGSMLFTSVRSLLLNRIYSKISLNVSAGTMMRLLSLPTAFFRQYSTGELNQYISNMDALSRTLVDSLFSSSVTGIFSLIYIGQIFAFAPGLVWPAIIVTLATLAVSMISAVVQMRVNRELLTVSAKERGFVYALITGIQKIRLSGAENRAFVKWSGLFSKGAALSYNPSAIIRLSGVITTAITMTGTAVMYYIAVRTQVSAADYYAFNSSYAYISSAFTALASVAITAASIKPTLELIKPLLHSVPEVEGERETVTSLSGSIELSHVKFSYTPGGEEIFSDLSLRIPARRYVAIVGKSGCGKSTLMRLMLGFEKPSHGAVYYDQKDISKLDLRSLRRQIGTVLQDGKLFSGSIYENIVISAPTLSMQDAWDAAEIAGLADDIRALPMGMHTVLQEGGGNLSGGQRQRLLIARAIAPKPRILMFDEATSALDNITQKKVSEALDKMKCTRIVIAHRLSTVRHCQSILVIDGGRIAEEGTYEQLIAKNGIFAELVARQMLDTDKSSSI